MRSNTPFIERPVTPKQTLPNPHPRRDLPREGLDIDKQRSQLVERYQRFFSDPQNTEEEVKQICAILEMAANDNKLCRLIEAIDEKEIPIKEARISCK
jgi:hypothetical protein